MIWGILALFMMSDFALMTKSYMQLTQDIAQRLYTPGLRQPMASRIYSHLQL